MGLFGMMPPGAVGAADSLYQTLQPPEEPSPMPRRRGFLGGLLGGGSGGGDFMMRLARAQAIMNGEYGQAAQIQARAAALEQDRQQAEAQAQIRAQASEALAARGYRKSDIAGMQPEQVSQLLLRLNEPWTGGPEGGFRGVANPGTGEMEFQTAPWQRQVGRSIIGGGPGGGPPQTIYQGVEPIAVQAGGNVYGMRGDGSFVDPVAPPPAGAPQIGPQTPAGNPNEAALRAQAADAIRRGADPAQVQQRLEQMLRGGPGQSGPATFPRSGIGPR